MGVEHALNSVQRTATDGRIAKALLALRQEQSQGLRHAGDLQAGGPAGQGGAFPLRGLFGQQRQVHEAAVHPQPSERVLQGIKHLVADKGARCLRHRGRKTRRLQARHQRLDGQGAEVSGRSPGDHRHIDGLCPRVVGNACVLHVDGHTLSWSAHGMQPLQALQARCLTCFVVPARNGQSCEGLNVGLQCRMKFRAPSQPASPQG